MIIKPGISPIYDEIRNKIISKYPDINIIDINPYYDISTFNHCAENQDILLSLECWKNIHPSLVTIPLKEKNFIFLMVLLLLRNIYTKCKNLYKILKKLLTVKNPNQYDRIFY